MRAAQPLPSQQHYQTPPPQQLIQAPAYQQTYYANPNPSNPLTPSSMYDASLAGVPFPSTPSRDVSISSSSSLFRVSAVLDDDNNNSGSSHTNQMNFSSPTNANSAGGYTGYDIIEQQQSYESHVYHRAYQAQQQAFYPPSSPSQSVIGSLNSQYNAMPSTDYFHSHSDTISVHSGSTPSPPLPKPRKATVSSTRQSTAARDDGEERKDDDESDINSSSNNTKHTSKKRKNGLSRKVACIICHNAKTSCDGLRPCQRCVRLDKTHMCVDRPSKIIRKDSLMNSPFIHATPFFPPFNMGGPSGSGQQPTAAIIQTPNGPMTYVPYFPTSQPTPVMSASPATPTMTAHTACNSSPSPSLSQSALPVAVMTTGSQSKSGKRRETISDSDDSGDDLHTSSTHHSPSNAAVTVSDDDIAVDSDNEAHSLSSSDHSDSDFDDAVANSVANGGWQASSPSLDQTFHRYLSRSLRAAHLEWFRRQRHEDPHLTNMNKLDLKGKLMFYTWMCQMMQQRDVEAVIHATAPLDDNVDCEPWSNPPVSGMTSGSEDEDTPAIKIEPSESSGAAHTVKPSHPHPQSQSRSQQSADAGKIRYERPPLCDGSICRGFCPSARAWSAANPCVYTWSSSPSKAIESDSPMEYPLIVIEYAKPTDEEEEKENRQLLLNTVLQKTQEILSKKRSSYGVRMASSRTETTASTSSDSDTQSTSSSINSNASTSLILESCCDERNAFCSSRDEQLMIASIEKEVNSQLLAQSTAVVPTLSSMLPASVLEVKMSVSVNASFERLFGYSQHELRQSCIRNGGKALYTLTRRDYWKDLMLLDQEASFGRQHEYKTYVACVTKWQGEVHCLVHTRYQFSDNGKFSKSTTHFIPLPDPKCPRLKRGGSGSKQRTKAKSKRKNQARK